MLPEAFSQNRALQIMTEIPKEKILVIKLGALGDFIQALGPMAAIRRHHPNADITLMTTSPFVSIAQKCGYFDHIWDHTRPKWKDIGVWMALRKRLNSEGFTRVYDLQNNDRTAFYLKLFSPRNKPEWVGAAAGASHRNNSPERIAGSAFNGHIQTLALAGIDNVTIDPMRWANDPVECLKSEEPYVLLVPGSSPKHPYKRWPAESYGHLARMIHGWGFQPVIIGTMDEQDIAKEICRIFPNTIDLTGKTTLFDVIALGRNAAAAIGNDTGPMHLIAPTECPCWVLFSEQTNPDRHAPLGTSVHTIQKESLSDLSVDEVIGQMKARDFRKKD